MAKFMTLFNYLQIGPPALPVLEEGWPDNTANRMPSYDDIDQIGVWNDFNLDTILHRHGQFLTEIQIEHDPMPTSPPPPVTSEIGLRHRAAFFLEARVRRALRRSFEQLAAGGGLDTRTVVSFGEGELAWAPNNSVPDFAYFATNQPASARPNRAPGELKPSFKWSSTQRNSPSARCQREFRQALSELNWYMRQNNAHYGFILTDRELVTIRRVDNSRRLELSESIPWAAAGSAAQPRLTVPLALWYLGMLASDDELWKFQ
ncbi:hypothetical protein VTN49DRAFT_1385 [Thermomyces lanuginosus]|uniref:uncharacterized protein n=1 Tax=Thermomyces lanuginosus TaxID=5541 RepID=UPI0037421E4D